MKWNPDTTQILSVITYNSPSTKPIKTIFINATIENKNVPYYEFKNNDLISIVAIKFHLAEGMFYYDGYAYIMFENSSSKYFFAEPKINNVLKYKIS